MSPIRQIILGAVIGVVFGLPFGFIVNNLPNIYSEPRIIKTTDPLAGYEIETIREMMIRYEINRYR